MSAMNRAEIEAAIPHRDPFLFLDTIVEHMDDGLTASWRVPADADWFRGHYPGQPVTPGEAAQFVQLTIDTAAADSLISQPVKKPAP